MSGDYFLVRRGATALRNSVVLDVGLSYVALGVLAVLLATPPGAPMGYRDLCGRGLGERAVRTALRELDEAGLRYQFRVRTPQGTLRTVTVVCDEPTSEAEALTSAQEMAAASGWGLVAPHRAQWGRSAPTDPPPPPAEPVEDVCAGQHRAATGAARLEPTPEGHETVTEREEGSEVFSQVSTVQCFTAARSTAARLTAARSDAAHRDKSLSKGSKDPLTYQTRASEHAPRGDGEGPVGSGPGARIDTQAPSPAKVPSPVEVIGASAHAGAGNVDAPGAPVAAAAPLPASPPPPSAGRREDRHLIASCLPEWMCAMDTEGAREVSRLLRERVAAGWQPWEIRQAVGANAPRGGVVRMAGLVITRLRRNVAVDMAPARLRGEAEEVRQRQRLGAQVEDERVRDPEWDRMWEIVNAELPEARMVERVRITKERLGRAS